MSTRLDNLAVISARGPASRSFLQGQLSQNLDKLAADDARLAGYHSPQGRVLTVMRLLPQGQQDVLMILPRELAPQIAARLAKFVLRAKTVIQNESDQWCVLGHAQIAPGLAAWADRAVSVASPEGLPIDTTPSENAQLLTAWRLADNAAGLPQVYAATSEQFIAQMLNLDALDAIAFNKGCYTGQEIIARAHYRGRVKRRMQRFATADAQPLMPGEKVTLSDGRSAQIVDAVRRDDGVQELLAVTRLLEQGESDTESAESSASGRQVNTTPLPLPYALPA